MDGSLSASFTLTDNFSGGNGFWIGDDGMADQPDAVTNIDEDIICKGTAVDSSWVLTDYASGNGIQYGGGGSASTKYVQTNTITLYGNITGYQLYSKKSINSTGAKVDYKISFDDGATWSDAKELNTKYANSTSGTSIKLKIQLYQAGTSGDYAKASNYGLLVGY